MPGGRMARCIIANPNVVFKICDSDRSYSKWRAVIIEGKAERLTNFDDILYSVRCIAKQRGFPENAFDNIARRVANDPASNSIRPPIKVFWGEDKRMTGGNRRQRADDSRKHRMRKCIPQGSGALATSNETRNGERGDRRQ